MVVYENDCCGCAVPGYPCLGNLCNRRSVRVLYCDRCGEEVYRLYVVNGFELCTECLSDEFEVIE